MFAKKERCKIEMKMGAGKKQRCAASDGNRKLTNHGILGTLAHDLHTPSKYGGHIEDQQDMVKIDTSAA